MQKYHFDLFDGEKVVADDYGDSFINIDEAAEQAAGILVDIAREALPSKNSQDFGVAVRSEDGRDVYRAALIFRDSYLDPNCPAVWQGTQSTLSVPNPADLIRRCQESRAIAKQNSDRLKNTAERLSENLRRMAETLQLTRATVADLR